MWHPFLALFGLSPIFFKQQMNELDMHWTPAQQSKSCCSTKALIVIHRPILTHPPSTGANRRASRPAPSAAYRPPSPKESAVLEEGGDEDKDVDGGEDA
eukprot:CAMPEP_0172032608 /NCGR_PEP_ID=MMETSP1041-20130122/19968_1 /TAXON_ID=464988 /ORGANISM="Hemiselmis andersenii, Strain CCMP439" /LENGTH=98 /DNA_ID=CAMNT_0012689275 /DNA_START=46 /DNA_END=343 /DNA_ORIENTATION=+